MFINSLGISGRVVNTPVLSTTQKGTSVVSVHIKNDDMENKALHIIIFGTLAERATGSLSGVPIRKGAVVYFQGVLKASRTDGALEMRCDRYVVQSSVPKLEAIEEGDDDLPY